jgi:hypothetical protein
LFIVYVDFAFVKTRRNKINIPNHSNKKVDLYEVANRIINETLNTTNVNITPKFFLSERIDINFMNLSKYRTT